MISITSCKKDSNQSSSQALSGSTIHGKISNWSLGSGKILKAYVNDFNHYLCESNVGADGSFTLFLKIPETNSLTYISSWFFDPQILISDVSTNCGYLELNIFNTSGYIGSVKRKSNANWSQVGDSRVEYYYVNKNTTLMGAFTNTFTIFDKLNTATYQYNLEFNTGWNTAAEQMSEMSVNTETAVTYTTKFTNIEPSNVKWLFYPNK